MTDTQLEQIRSAANLAVLMGEDSIALRRASRGFMCCCPFHDDSTPSMAVLAPGKGYDHWHYKCHGCEAKGDAFSYLMARHGMPFPDAARILANRFGVMIEEIGKPLPSPRTTFRPDQRPPAINLPAPVPDPSPAVLAARRAVYGLVINLLAREHTGAAAIGPEGRAYLEERGLDTEAAGYHGFRSLDGPVWWARLGERLAQAATDGLFTTADLLASGLWRNEGGALPQYVAPWKGKVPALVIPYYLGGDVVGLRFRAIGDARPKYLTLAGAQPHVPFNAPALDVIYALHDQGTPGTLHIVEGELNAFALTLHDEAAIGVPGVQTWRPQWARLVRDAGRVVLWYDNDPAREPDKPPPGEIGAQLVIDSLALSLGRSWLQRVVRQPLPPGRDTNDLHQDGLLDDYLRAAEGH